MSIANQEDIKKILPHRDPFLLIDSSEEMSEEKIVGTADVLDTDFWVPGHFPQEPVMPGVLQIEAMAQTGGLLVLSGLDDPEKYSTHKLRHTAATLMYQYGQVDIRMLQQILGHESVATTEIYTHVNEAHLHEAVESNPLAKESAKLTKASPEQEKPSQKS